MQINNAVAIIAAVMMILSRVIKSFELILIGRFLYGFNVGMCCLIRLQASHVSFAFC